MNEQQLAEVYQMVDNVGFSRQKKNIGRDFSDGLMMAELIYHYYPKRVELHNYPSTNTVTKKIQNWSTLNNKVLKKMGLGLSLGQIQEIANSKPMSIQKFLYRFLLKFQRPEQQVKIPNRFQNKQQAQRNSQNKPKGIISFPNKKGEMTKIKRQNQDTQQVLDLIDKIDYAYAQLVKLQQMSRLKDDIIRNLQKKVQTIIFN